LIVVFELNGQPLKPRPTLLASILLNLNEIAL
jgi:hypothetical protein